MHSLKESSDQIKSSRHAQAFLHVGLLQIPEHRIVLFRTH